VVKSCIFFAGMRPKNAIYGFSLFRIWTFIALWSIRNWNGKAKWNFLDETHTPKLTVAHTSTLECHFWLTLHPIRIKKQTRQDKVNPVHMKPEQCGSSDVRMFVDPIMSYFPRVWWPTLPQRWSWNVLFWKVTLSQSTDLGWRISLTEWGKKFVGAFCFISEFTNPPNKFATSII
jgi:hypothetical protein